MRKHRTFAVEVSYNQRAKLRVEALGPREAMDKAEEIVKRDFNNVTAAKALSAKETAA